MTVAFTFPGQGSQTVGMGKALADAFFEANAVFETVDEALGEKLSDIIFNGSLETLTLTENAQPALMAVSSRRCACWKRGACASATTSPSSPVIRSANIRRWPRPAVSPSPTRRGCCGRAGRAMQRAVPVGSGGDGGAAGHRARRGARGGGRKLRRATSARRPTTMAAGRWCDFRNEGRRSSGALDIAKAKGAKRAILLPVSAPFHSALMAPAAKVMEEALAEVTINPPSVPLVANVLAGADHRPGRDPQAAGRAGHRAGALAGIGRVLGGAGGDDIRRGRRGQGALGAGAAHRSGRRDASVGTPEEIDAAVAKLA